MAAIAVVVVDMASGGLLRVQPEFGVAVTALDTARENTNSGDQNVKRQMMAGTFPEVIFWQIPRAHVEVQS